MTHPDADSTRPTYPTLSYSPTGRLAPWVPRFLTVFAVAQVAVILAVCLPVLVGVMSLDTLDTVIPVVALSPTLLLLIVHLAFRRPVPFVRWAALGITPAHRTFGVIGLLTVVMLLIPVLTIAIATLLGLVDFVPAEDGAAVVLMLVPIIVISVVATLGEEIAWRGYLQSTLASLGFWRSTLLIGTFWSLVHLPLSMAYSMDEQSAAREVLFTSVNLLLIAVVLSAVRYLSGSVWPAVVGHTLLNTVLVFAYTDLITPTAQLTDLAFWGYAVVTWAVWGLAIGFLVHRVAQQPRPYAANPPAGSPGRAAPPARRR